MEIKVIDGNLVISLPLQVPQRSKTGRSRIVATTAGFVKTNCLVEGQPVSISINACIPLK